MAELPPKIQKSCRQSQSIKPSNAVIRQLFGKADRNETRKMLEKMIELENERLSTRWHVDVRQLFSTGRSSGALGESNGNLPRRPKTNQYVWEKQDAANVPSFYTRKPHTHHSDPKLLRENFCESFLIERKARKSPQPLCILNANQVAAPRPLITSPVKLSLKRQDRSSVQLVLPIRCKLRTECHDVSPKKNSLKHEKKTHEDPSNSLSLPELVPTSKASTSKKLFQTEKFAQLKRAGKQLKITGNPKAAIVLFSCLPNCP